MKKITAIIFTLFSALGLIGQTADIYSGCSPLTVQFTPPTGVTNALWDFGDGSTSNLSSPGHTFDESGMFLVQISENGLVIGDTTITIYATTEVMISADEQEGCAPFRVQFTDESIVDPGLSVSGYLWDFGDGTSSPFQNPFHIYAAEGIYTVSLRVDSEEEGCTVSQPFPDFIIVTGKVDVKFELDRFVSCENPGTFIITNTTVDEPGYTYSWDFGNGETSNLSDPASITYDSKGTYKIILTVDNGQGCEVSFEETVTVGKPNIDITVKDTFCINSPYTIINNSEGGEFKWSFGSGSIPQTSTLKNPTVRYNTPGVKIVTFSAIASTDCKSDSLFTIFVEDPSATFTIDPFVTCLEPATYTFTHPNPNYAEYEYYVRQLDDLFLGKESEMYTYTPPPRDSFYINRSDTFSVILNVTTHAGCTAEDSTFFIHRAPQAHFIPNISRGCAPLTVNFTEDSRSNEPITNWTWIFGDGDVVNTTMSEDMTHLYTEPGEYYVKIAIENEDGCQDTSAGIFIYVGEPLTAEYTVDETEICLYESTNMSTDNLDPRIDAYHFNTDDGRISDCYTNTVASHEFMHSPGVYPVTLTLEYNGCYSEIDNGATVTVNGSKSRIKYMTNCLEPLTVMLQDSSVNANTSIWYMNGDTINMDTVATNPFNYTFDSTGNYTVLLITDDGTACPADTSTVELKIREIKADFDLPEFVCANATIDIGAGASIDVDESCSKGYMWFGVAIRPRTLDTAVVVAAFGPGTHTVRLITEDVNGCTDTLDRETTALEIFADFESDDEIVCFPTNIDFTDLSVADTTIVEWNWDFGGVNQNPTNVVFTNYNDYVDGIPIQLAIEDELGCVDTLIKIIPTYEPSSTVSFDPFVRTVCVGESINMSATDFTAQGHFLTYEWRFEGESSTNQSTSFELNQSGSFPLKLTIIEDSTLCNNEYDFTLIAVDLPIADITIDENLFCIIDGSVQFPHASFLDGPGKVDWYFELGTPLDGFIDSLGSWRYTSPGIYDVKLTVSSDYGCSDTDSITIEMIEPSGSLAISDEDNKICINDEVTFTLINAIDVDSFEIDFGEGNVVKNISPATNTFGYYPPNGTYDVVLSLISDTGCKTSVNIPVEAFRVAASIDFDTLLCIGKADFFNAADTFGLELNYDWDFGNNTTSTNPTETVFYQTDGEYLITLSVADSNSGCSDEDMVTITIDNTLGIPNLFTPNGDDHNDFFDLIVNEECRDMVIPEMFKVYNRWGNLMYDNELPLEGWDGKLSNGDTAPAEIYTFVVKVDGVEKVFKGTVTLIK